MSKVKVSNFSISLDGFGAGPDQDLNNPLGTRGLDLHQWLFPTDFFQQMVNGKPGESGVDNDFAVRGLENIGAVIMGRNMFGPIRGNWTDNNWKGWWNENPPFHCPVYVLTNHAREPITMEGGTIFHFITEGIEAALKLAKDSAGSRNIHIGGGVGVIQQYLKAKLIDEIHLAFVPVILGSGEKFFENINLLKLGYKCVKSVSTHRVIHVVLAKENN